MERQVDRLRTAADFQRVRQGGRAWTHPLFVLAALPNALDKTRVGLLVSRRVGNAVKRNRARRLLREAVRHCLPRVRAGWDMVLIARPPLVASRLQPVEAALEQLLRRGALLNDAAQSHEAKV